MGNNKTPILLFEKERLIDFLNTRSKLDTNTGCINWLRCVKQGTHNYGSVHLKEGHFKAHRLSAYIYNGLDIFDTSILVCHKCDNPRCINKDHLFLASHKWNMADASSKNRMKRLSGSSNPSSKLTIEQVEYLKRNQNKLKKYKELAVEFGVNEMTIYRVIKNKSWKS